MYNWKRAYHFFFAYRLNREIKNMDRVSYKVIRKQNFF